MAIDLTDLGRRLREARVNCDITQDDAAKTLDVSRAAIIQIENGEREVSLEQLNAFARIYSRPVAEFVAESPENLLVTLLRSTPDLDDPDLVEAEIMRHVSICRAGADLERVLGLSARTGPPAYDVPAPESVGEAVEQGEMVARNERRRLGLGDNPIPDVADVITATGIWASGSTFPDEMSGLFLRHPDIGMVILVNYRHARSRKRFSYAHEYAHALLDRTHTATISTQRNRAQLHEVRANAFAASFLLPPGGVRGFLFARRKGLQSRQDTLAYDPSVEGLEEPIRGTRRTAPGSQTITYKDVAILAHFFGASYQASAYRMKGLNLVNERELKALLDKQDVGRDYFRALAFDEELDEEAERDPKKRDRELVSQVVDLAIEAFRQDQISTDRLLELGTTLGIGGRMLVTLAQAAT